MRIAFITRSTWRSVPGGDTIQLTETAQQLRELGVEADILPADSRIDYAAYDLFHLFNITRPADLLVHAVRCKKPYVLSPILIDYSAYDRHYRKGLSGFIFRYCPPAFNEYLKTVARSIRGNDKLVSRSYLWKGQLRSMQELIAGAAAILPNSESEQRAMQAQFNTTAQVAVIPNGVKTALFNPDPSAVRDPALVICAARIEGIKNQLTLIRALHGTPYRLVLIGRAAPGQLPYLKACQQAAADNVRFTGSLSQEELLHYYRTAAVHVLPSWFETCGLSSLEAAAAGCPIVVTDKGYTRDYFGDHAFYAAPSSPASIREQIEQAMAAGHDDALQKKISSCYTWQKAASLTLGIYQKILSQ